MELQNDELYQTEPICACVPKKLIGLKLIGMY
jgi:hypothetical protein